MDIDKMYTSKTTTITLATIDRWINCVRWRLCQMKEKKKFFGITSLFLSNRSRLGNVIGFLSTTILHLSLFVWVVGKRVSFHFQFLSFPPPPLRTHNLCREKRKVKVDSVCVEKGLEWPKRFHDLEQEWSKCGMRVRERDERSRNGHHFAILLIPFSSFSVFNLSLLVVFKVNVAFEFVIPQCRDQNGIMEMMIFKGKHELT